MKAKRAATIAIEDLPALIAQIRGQGQTIGTLNGCFDVLHCGHLRIIEDAAASRTCSSAA
ncbi:MAG: hypothetical protein HC888_08115 [Candidatus Competibacteraceae bacterium]|nr:hypothetical protein [Candidatus Competibacteraceae bacterium]